MNSKFMAVLLTCLSITTLANAQVYYSTLLGTVRDATGWVISEAGITAIEVRTGVRTGVATSATTGADGNYRIATLRPGIHNISVTKANFKTGTIEDIELFVGQTTRIDIGLEVGDVMQKVAVEGHAPL